MLRFTGTASSDSVLVTLADERWVRAAKQLFASAVLRGGWSEDLLILTTDDPRYTLSESDERYFERQGVIIARCSLFEEDLAGTYPPIVYAKLFLFHEAFKTWKRVVCIDADTIIRSSILPLTKTAGFSAVEGPVMNRLSHFFYELFEPRSSRERKRTEHEKLCARIESEYDLNELAFNAGVMSFTTDLIDKTSFSTLLSLYRTYRPIVKNDEFILNLFLYRRWNRLPLAYNAQAWNVFGWKARDRDGGVVLHFMVRNRPWEPENPLHELWLDNLNEAAHLAQLAPTPVALSAWRLRFLSLRQRAIRAHHWSYCLLKHIEYRYGQVGLKIRRHRPSLYRVLKRILP